MSKSLHAPDALLPTGWAQDVLLTWDASGQLTQVQAGTSRPKDAAVAKGFSLSSLVSTHPPVEKRIERLMAMQATLDASPAAAL